MAQFFCFLRKKVLITGMQMQMLANYVDPYCCTLSDALLREGKTSAMIVIVIFYIQIGACKTKFVHLSEIYESEMRDAQVDGSVKMFHNLSV